jgi:error-prone DNA polymerase
VVRVTPGYAELHCLSNFSFQQGASSVDQLFERAKAMGYEALAITDECALAGIVRAWQASEKHGVRLIVGAELQVAQGPKLVLLVQDLQGYQQLCRLITLARRRAEKGSYRLLREDLSQVAGLVALWVPDRGAEAESVRWLLEVLPDRLWIAAELHFDQDDQVRLQQLQELGAALGLPWWPPATCTCTAAGAGPCRTPSPRSAITSR